MDFTTRPLDDRTWIGARKPRRESTFTASWSQTLDLLAAEVDHLGGSRVTFDLDLTPQQIRLDGLPRAGARAGSPAVIVGFSTKDHGDLSYRCDRLRRGPAHGYRNGSRVEKMPEDWQHNVRAVALSLEALRAVSRYGALAGEQYVGNRALPPGSGSGPSHMTTGQAWQVLADVLGVDPAAVSTDASYLPDLVRASRRVTHPDRHGGDRAAWDRVEQAANVLGA